MSEKSPQFPPGKAAVFNGPGRPFKMITGEVPAIGKDEILVKNLYTTICGSDVHTYCGHRKEPDEVVLGHEIVGHVLWFDPETPLKDFEGNEVEIGDRIVWSIFAVPPGVESPRPDMPQKSDRLFKYGHNLAKDNDVFNGGLADYCILRPNTAFIKISANIPVKVAATISCAHATVAGSLRIAGDIKGKRVMIFGAGLLGLSCCAMCKETGAEWIGLIDNDNSRLQWGTKFGADETYLLSGNTGDDTTSFPEADIVFDMTGSPDAMRAGIDLLALGGTAVWIGAVFPAKPVQIDAEQIVRKLLKITGLHNYNYQDFVNATSFVANNYHKYPFEALVEIEFELDDVENAFRSASKDRPVRVGVKIS
jgi:putative phosphonate catabolism associated alcohol dehydrogenase